MEKLKKVPIDSEVQPPPKRRKIPGVKYLGRQEVDQNQNNIGEGSDLEIIQLVSADLATLQADFTVNNESLEEDCFSDPLMYWQLNGNKYKTVLSEFACDTLSSPSSSVPCERMFSISGIMSAGDNIFLFYLFLS